MNGLKKAILYSLKPHELGFCGPQGDDDSKNILRNYLLGKRYPREIVVNLLHEFHGSSGYYSLIARSNNIKNFYNKRVVEAYWIGNELLDKVRVGDLKKMILTNFVSPQLLTKTKVQKIINRIPARVVPHHSFHVFFIGSITGRVKVTPRLKDECKVSWGKVARLFNKGGKVEVKTIKLFPKEREIHPAQVYWGGVKIKVDWDKRFLPGLRKGDLVSWHWGRVVEKLTKKEYDNLAKYTIINYSELKSVK